MAEQPHFVFFGLFPSCLKKGVPPQQGADTGWPINLPLDQFMKWIWRVESWELTSESSTFGTETATTFPPNPENYSNVWGTKPVNQFPKTVSRVGLNPENFSCQQNLFTLDTNIQGEATVIQGGDPFKVPFTHAVQLRIELNDTYINGNTVYPKFSGNPSGWASTRKYSVPKVNAGVKINMTLDGVNIPMFVYWQPNWIIYPSWTASGTTTYVIEPKTYFSYGGTYDTQTGQVIKPF
jgi:hypothetical protein